MSINDIREKIKPYWQKTAIPIVSRIRASLDIKEDIFIVLAILLIGLAGFGLGKLSALEKGREPVKIMPAKLVTSADGKSRFIPITSTSSEVISKATAVPASAAAMISSDTARGMLVASKGGTKYHFPWCAGASQILEANKIWFNSYDEAVKAGYTAAANCPNLK